MEVPMVDPMTVTTVGWGILVEIDHEVAILVSAQLEDKDEES